MTNFQPFVMERMMSKWENEVDYNLSESGVHPISLRELLQDSGEIDKLLDVEFGYAQANGIPELRENIAALYPGAGPDNILVTVGCIEANYNAIQTLLSPGDEMVIMLPNYMQIWGAAKNVDVQVKGFHLNPENGWSPDLEQLNQAVSENTKLISICNPNNPTGYILTEKEMDAIVAVADRVGAWILADEVYRGAERVNETETLSFWGRYDKVLATNSMSKAYGLPGLRIGWVVGPEEVVDEIWARHEYTTLSATTLSNRLAAFALSPSVRSRIMQRTRGYIRRGFPILEEWMNSNGDSFSLISHQAAAMAFIRYNLNINSTKLVERLFHEKKILIVPGDHFGLDNFIRISFGLEPDYLRAGLNRIGELVKELRES